MRKNKLIDEPTAEGEHTAYNEDIINGMKINVTWKPFRRIKGRYYISSNHAHYCAN